LDKKQIFDCFFYFSGEDEPFELALEEQQDYDVADLVKQFFRELPEALMTTKLSDTFLAVFQRESNSNNCLNE
jgi:RhoGAP domain